MPLTAVILAAGAGARLGELGRRHSKAMLPIAGRPLIEWVLGRLRGAGVERVVVVGHPSDVPLENLLRGNHPDAVLARQPDRKGIADALCHALALVNEEPAYLACACDSLFSGDDVRAVIAHGRSHAGVAVIGVMEMGAAATATRSAVQVSGKRVTRIVEKPPPGTATSGVVAMPLYWLPRSVGPYLKSAPAIGGERFISTALAEFIAAGGVVEAVVVRDRIEITTAEDVQRAEQRLALPT